MSGSVAAIAAYDGTGTQGYGTTDKNLPDVKSVFWNENDTDKYYVNGCSLSEVSSNKGSIDRAEVIVFTFDNDSDAINDLTLLIERKGKLQKTDGSKIPSHYMIYFVERIEVCVGNQVISTMNTTQLVKEFFEMTDHSAFTNYVPTSPGQINTELTGVSAQKINLNIFRMLSKNGMDSSYLMCCANNQTLQIKVYPQNLSDTDLNSYMNVNGAVTLTDIGLTFSLYANKYTITNAERDFLRNQVVPKRTNITQFAELSSGAIPEALSIGDTITINCDHFNLYTSNLYILGSCNNELTGLGGFDVELYLNSTSYSGILSYCILFNQPNVWDTTQFFNYKIPISKNSHMKETDQAYVPFSKFDSIRVVLTAKKDVTVSDYADFFNTLTVVAEGKCTALYQNGAVVFNNY